MSAAEFQFRLPRDLRNSAHEYLARIRLQNAADLLQNTDKKIIDIAEECGFFSISNFIKAFNNGMGMSPSRYRKECGEPDRADKPADD